MRYGEIRAKQNIKQEYKKEKLETSKLHKEKLLNCITDQMQELETNK